MAKETIEADRMEIQRERERFGLNVLRRKREALGLTLDQMAELSGVSQTTLTRYERGEQGSRDIAILIAVVDHYQLDQEETDTWLYLNSGIFDFSTKLTKLAAILETKQDIQLPSSVEPDLEQAQDLVNSWLFSVNQTASALAKKIRMDLATLSRLLKEEITEEFAMKPCVP